MNRTKVKEELCLALLIVTVKVTMTAIVTMMITTVPYHTYLFFLYHH